MIKALDRFKYKTSIPFIRWIYPEEKKSDLNGLFQKRSVLPELFLVVVLYTSFNIWADTAQNVGGAVIYAVWAVIVFLLFTLALANIKTLLLPDVITKPLTILIIAFQLLIAISTNDSGVIWSAILGGLVVGGTPYLLFLVSRGRWIGFGDVKLGFAAGLLLGLDYGLLCLGFVLALAILSMSIEYASSKASKIAAPVRVGTGVIWVLSIFLALFAGRQLFS
jgi:prepilin signal peptidase PulO-like enzyme (type II secretory pathway)